MTGTGVASVEADCPDPASGTDARSGDFDLAQDAATIADLWYLARRAVHRLERVMDRDLREAVGLPAATFALLRVLEEPTCANQQEIAELLGLTKGSVSRQVDAAAGAGLVVVEVSAMSRREKVVRLTTAGSAVVAKGQAVVDRYELPADRGDLAVTLRTLAAVPE